LGFPWFSYEFPGFLTVFLLFPGIFAVGKTLAEGHFSRYTGAVREF